MLLGGKLPLHHPPIDETLHGSIDVRILGIYMWQSQVENEHWSYRYSDSYN